MNEMKNLIGWYNYDTGEYDCLSDTPDDLIPYLPNDIPAYRNVYKLLIEHKKMNPVDAYLKILESGTKND